METSSGEKVQKVGMREAIEKKEGEREEKNQHRWKYGERRTELWEVLR